MAERLRNETVQRNGLPLESAAPDPDLVEAACLGHDLGHPPFGHVGEKALCEALDTTVEAEVRQNARADTDPQTLEESVGTACIDAGGFEGNAQTFRIAAFLSVRGLAEGLDLTRATLDALTKYPWGRGEDPKHPAKWGFFPPEGDLMAWVRDHQVGAGQTQCIEAQVMDWADDVTYACHDVEDFYRVGLIPLDRLFDYRTRDPNEIPPEAARFFAWAEAKWRVGNPPRDWDGDRVKRVWRQLSNLILVLEPFRATRQLEIDIRRSTSELLSYFVNGITVSGTSPMRLYGRLDVPEDQRLGCDLLNELIWFYVIEQPALATQQHGQALIVQQLFMAYYEGPDRMLPETRQEELAQHSDRRRCVADHIASMTEGQAVALHRRLVGTDVSGILEPIWAT
jgi:dGTPase